MVRLFFLSIFLIFSFGVFAQRAVSIPENRHGEVQATQMLLDRPAMQTVIEKGDTLWNFIVGKYGGEDLPVPIFWENNPENRPMGYPAFHQYPTEDQYGFIWLKADSVEEMWFNAIFELNNIANHAGFFEVHNGALEGLVDREAYIRGHAQLEYLALRKTLGFYIGVWKPLMTERNVITDSTIWRTDLENTFDEWLAGYPPESHYPWAYYGGYFDRFIIPYLEEMAAYEEMGFLEWVERELSMEEKMEQAIDSACTFEIEAPE